MLELLYKDCWEAVAKVRFMLLRVQCITIPSTDLTTSAPIDQNGYRAA
jgi:hypothetical protein